MRNSKRKNERGSNNVNGWLHAVNYRLGCRLVVCFLRLCTLKEPPLRQKFENSRAFRLMLTELIRRRLLLLLSEDERNGNHVQFGLYCKNRNPVLHASTETEGGAAILVFESTQERFNEQKCAVSCNEYHPQWMQLLKIETVLGIGLF
ncbi:hypothetical protein T4A_12468 [Trichinella pseudospiralis]|uniref:Uncharacterized protein n=1 Tax=Trichinella pseudospiralis TaxID=6337 RepID=A0A0V1FEX6_TRIPS|nr:hypothetical protein T4A_12468 [Trichinella pseudospiralis]KRY84612.1 hypothetical protein T4D_3407 [Trichinella pseudospiralis]